MSLCTERDVHCNIDHWNVVHEPIRSKNACSLLITCENWILCKKMLADWLKSESDSVIFGVPKFLDSDLHLYFHHARNNKQRQPLTVVKSNWHPQKVDSFLAKFSYLLCKFLIFSTFFDEIKCPKSDIQMKSGCRHFCKYKSSHQSKLHCYASVYISITIIS